MPSTAAKQNLRVQAWIVGIGTLLMLIKFVAYWITGSNAILSDALESIINVVAGGLGMYSLYLASLPKDENHPYGHGKIEFISASIEGGLIAAAGSIILVKGVWDLIHPHEVQQLDIGLGLTLIAGTINFLLGWMAERRGRTVDSATLVASGEHLKSDAYSTVGLLAGLILIYFTDWYWADNLFALFFGGLILWTGYKILRRSIAGIMDETDYKLIEKVVTILQEERRDNWMDLHNLRIVKYGSDLHIDCHLTVPWYFNVREAHNEADELEALFQRHFKQPVELFIHLDACHSSFCSFCKKEDCSYRKADFKGQVEWRQDNVLLNAQHVR